MVELAYLIYWDDDRVPLEPSMTVGSNLENDLVVAGEDVAEFHLRIEVNDRGPLIIPLNNATVTLNGRELAQPHTVVPGDTLGVGQCVMQIGTEVERASEFYAWRIESTEGSLSVPLRGEVIVGRQEDAEICLLDEHISRQHARLFEKDGYVWLQDLGSANGSQVNGQPLQGGVRLYHGDYLLFDKIEFQIVGDGADVTPVMRYKNPLQPTLHTPPANQFETTEVVALGAEFATQVEDTSVVVANIGQSLGANKAGAFLVGTSEPVQDRAFALHVGDNLVGRGTHNDIVIADNTVSSSHAKITVRPESVTISNLLATNGTRVNGADVATHQLADGDVLRLGRINLVFKDVQTTARVTHWLDRARVALIAGSVVMAGLLAVLLW